MKKAKVRKSSQVCFMAAIVLLFMLMVASPLNVRAERVKMNKSRITVYVGAATQLNVSGISKKVRWNTSKKSIVGVSKTGKITGKKVGTAIVTAKVGEKELRCRITVKPLNSSQRQNLAKKQAKKIVKKYIRSDMNAAERAYVLYRYLTEHCTWQINQSDKAYKKNYGNEAYAALIMKKAACSGYARAYTLLCNQAKVPVRHINSGNWTHQWNNVKINGQWIKVDTFEGTFESTEGIRDLILRDTSSGNGHEKVIFSFTTNL